MVNKVIDGVGADAEVITNEAGGKQSKSPMALHLVDPMFLADAIDGEDCGVISEISSFMLTGNKDNLLYAIDLCESPPSTVEGFLNDIYKCPLKAVIKIAKVLQYGADRYEPNNWRLIPQEEHINHALIHYVAYLMGDTQDEHIEHCMCRLMMAYATEKSENFNYNTYIPTGK